MKRLLPLVALALGATAHADPNAPLMFQMGPQQYHAYQNDPPPPLTLTLTLKNPTARPVPLKCLSVGGPVLRRYTAYQDYRSLGRDEALGELEPQGNAPICRTVGEVITLPAGARYTYTRALGPQKVGGQVEYRSGWNVSVAPGSGWLQRASASALVVRGARPIATPNPQAYQAALDASRADWQTRGNTGRLSFRLSDERSRQAFLAELKKRGLDASKVDIEVAPPVRFSLKPGFAHTAKVTVTQAGRGYSFTLKVTNKTGGPFKAFQYSCEPLAIERVRGGLRVWQVGNGPCADVGIPPVTLQPGQSTTRTAEWNGTDSLGQRVPPGQYRVKMGLGQFVGWVVFTVK